jgi:hypothetical protein
LTDAGCWILDTVPKASAIGIPSGPSGDTGYINWQKYERKENMNYDE